MPASDHEDEAEDELGAGTKQLRVHSSIANVATIVIQNWNRHGIRAPMLAPLSLGDKLHYRSNVTALLGAILYLEVELKL